MAEARIERSKDPREDFKQRVESLQGISDNVQCMTEAMSVVLQAQVEDPWHDNSSVVDEVYQVVEARMASVPENDPDYDKVQSGLALVYIYSDHPEKAQSRAVTIMNPDLRNNVYLLSAEGFAKREDFDQANQAVAQIDEQVEFGQDGRGSGYRLNARLKVLAQAARHHQDLEPIFAQLKGDVNELESKVQQALAERNDPNKQYEGAKYIFRGAVGVLEHEQNINKAVDNSGLIRQIQEEFPEYFGE